MAMTTGERRELINILVEVAAESKTARETKNMYGEALSDEKHYQYWDGVEGGLERADAIIRRTLRKLGIPEKGTQKKMGEKNKKPEKKRLTSWRSVL